MAKIYGTFTTPKGSELNLIDLKGKPYLLAADRLLWFREMFPTGIVKSSIISHQDETVVFKAEVYIKDESGQPLLVSTAHKMESKKTFPDYIEKAETSALARALAMAGFGTQFTGGELDEGSRLADAPIVPAKRAATKKRSSFRAPTKETKTTETSVGDDI